MVKVKEALEMLRSYTASWRRYTVATYVLLLIQHILIGDGELHMFHAAATTTTGV